MLLRDMDEADRPEPRLFRHGGAALSNAELLSLLLRGNGDRLDRAQRLLADAGGLVGLSGHMANQSILTRCENAAVRAALEIARRLPSEGIHERDLFNEPDRVKEFLRRTQGDDAQERTGALFLNSRNRLLKNEPEIYLGTLDRAVVEPREILRRGLLHKACGIILYHNHPSGDPTPSREDREFTRRLNAAADAVGLRLLDHIVVGREGCVSFREAGLL